MNDANSDSTREELAEELNRARQRIAELESRLALEAPHRAAQSAEVDAPSFEALFDKNEIQRIQDTFAHATGVASLITTPDGTPLTRPSNFSRLCEIIRKTPEGHANCVCSDAFLGRPYPHGPIVQHCLSGGLWDAGASIYAGERHIASWLIGQVRDQSLHEDQLLAYAAVIGADPDEYRAALAEVTVMSPERFVHVAQALFLIASLISRLAYHNQQQAFELRRRSEIEKMLRESEQTFRGIIDNMQDAYYRSDAAGRLVMCSPSILKLVGYDSLDEIIGTDIAEQFYLYPNERDAFLKRLAAEGQVSDYDVTLRRKDGQPLAVRTSSHFYYDQEGRVLGVEGVFSNVTQRKLMEQELALLNRRLEETVDLRTRELTDKAGQLAEANRRLVEIDTARTAFLSSISHELRTPLTSVIGFSKQVAKDMSRIVGHLEVGDDLDLRRVRRVFDNLGIIAQEGERLTRLLNDFLDLAKIESGMIQWHDQDVDPRDVLDNALTLMRGLFAEKPEVVLLADLPESLPRLRIDPDRLTQVVINLLGNALKFTHHGSVALLARATSTHLTIEVRDTGIGIAPESQNRIFEKFQQASDGDTLTRPGGTGLGLAICHDIVEHYGGHIRVESGPGKGSAFSVELPLG